MGVAKVVRNSEMVQSLVRADAPDHSGVARVPLQEEYMMQDHDGTTDPGPVTQRRFTMVRP